MVTVQHTLSDVSVLINPSSSVSSDRMAYPRATQRARRRVVLKARCSHAGGGGARPVVAAVTQDASDAKRTGFGRTRARA